MAENQGLDANAVINKLANKNAELSRTLAITEVQYDTLRNAYDKQAELVAAYEEKYEANDKEDE